MQKRGRSTDREEMVAEQGLIGCAELTLPYLEPVDLIGCAELTLPYLEPVDLASISLTCKALNVISKIITFRRSCDASNGFEKFPIPFTNLVDDQRYTYFTYVPTQTLPASSFFVHQPFGCNRTTASGLVIGQQDPFLFRVEGATGCECESCDVDSECPCSVSMGLLGQECGPSCLCDSRCGSRGSQRGILVKLRIMKDRKKGWGLYADEPIAKGNFVCEYAGELLGTKEARMRQQSYDELVSKHLISPALLVVKEHLPSANVCIRINIDATRVGNVARFINHSCDGGNLETVIVRSPGALLPRICFYASRDIQENEELSFSYGDIRLNQDGLPCFCGSSCCFGILPSENT